MAQIVIPQQEAFSPEDEQRVFERVGSYYRQAHDPLKVSLSDICLNLDPFASPMLREWQDAKVHTWKVKLLILPMPTLPFQSRQSGENPRGVHQIC